MAITVYKTRVTSHSLCGYRASHIEAIEADRVTDKSVFIKGRRRALDSDYDQHHDTWERAHAFILEKAKTRLVAAQNALLRAEADLGDVEALKPPKE